MAGTIATQLDVVLNDFERNDIVYVKWSKLFKIIQKIQNDTNFFIYKDLIKAFELNGYYPFKWLKDLKFNEINLSYFPNILEVKNV